jgi:hypothetical protein
MRKAEVGAEVGPPKGKAETPRRVRLEGFDRAVGEAKSIIAKAEREGRDLTKDEADRVESLIKRADALKRDDQLGKSLDELGGFGESSGGSRPAKNLSTLVRDALRQMGAKDLSATPSAIVSVDFIGVPGVVEGLIGSRVFAEFPQRRVDGGSVRYLRQVQTVAKVPAAVVSPG